MLNEGILQGNPKVRVKTEMVKQLHELGETNAKQWEGRVFTALTGGTREDIDWDVKDNKAGYFQWVKTFDGLITELVEDGYATVESHAGTQVIKPVASDGPIDYSRLSDRDADQPG